MQKLPDRVEDIDMEWVGSILSSAAPAARITAIRTGEVIHGACTKVRILLEGDLAGLPERLVLKAGFEPHSEAMSQMHVNEMHAYRDFIPTLKTSAPLCLFAEVDSEGRALVLLEDLSLRGVEFLSLLDPIDFETAAAFLVELAALHARWWGPAAPIRAALPWLPDTGEDSFHHYFGILTDPARFARFLERPRCAAMPRHLLDPIRVRAAHQAMRARHRDMPFTVLHGDMHLGNLYLDSDGAPGFLDWQPRLAPWSVDVSYFLVAALDLVDRRRWEERLLGIYLAALAARGVAAPMFPEAWDAYRRDIVWGHLIWMLNGWAFQPESVNTAAATRFAMAMVDHGTFEMLGV